MDPEKRKQLEERRAAMKANPPPPQIEGTIIPRLVERGVPREARFDGIWTPPYIRVTGNTVWWPECPDPAESDFCWFRDEDDPDGNLTEQKRIDVIGAMIARATAPETTIRFGYDTGFETDIALTARDAVANLDVLLDFRWTIWITAKPEPWLIEMNRDSIARLALPPGSAG